MANEPWGQGRQVQAAPTQQTEGSPTLSEPPVRRWPHPVDGTEPIQAGDPALHYIRCSLSYQNQLLAEIKTLLEQLTVDRTTGEK